MAVADDLSIVNEAFVRLGAPPVGSFADQSAQATGVGALYDRVRDDLISEYPWVFAVREKALAKLVVPVADHRLLDYGAIFQLPADTLRVLGLTSYGPFRLAGDQLYTDSADAEVVYISRTPASAWPSYFAEALSKELAAALALTITDSSVRQQLAIGEARRAIQRAKALDGQQQPAKVINLMRFYARRSVNPLSGA